MADKYVVVWDGQYLISLEESVGANTWADQSFAHRYDDRQSAIDDAYKWVSGASLWMPSPLKSMPTVIKLVKSPTDTEQPMVVHDGLWAIEQMAHGRTVFHHDTPTTRYSFCTRSGERKLKIKSLYDNEVFVDINPEFVFRIGFQVVP